MRLFSYRKLPIDFNQDIYIWDVDKTYLNTNFESLRGLIKILFEFSIDKKSIPGSKELLSELRKGVGAKISVSPIFFISASPVSLKKVLEGKFLIDGIQHDGLMLKDYGVMRKIQGRIRLKNNFPYKLICLLTHRLSMPVRSTEVLFGDNYERDADVYSLYAQILHKQINEVDLKNRLSKEKLSRKEIGKILSLAKEVWALPAVDVSNPIVRKIFIHLVKNQSIESFAKYGFGLVPTRNYIQTAALLFEMGKITKSGFRRVANAFDLKYPKDGWTLAKSLQDLQHRSLIQSKTYEELSSWK